MVLSFTSHALWRFPAQRQRRAGGSIVSARRSAALPIAKLAVLGMVGALLSWMSPFSPAMAMAMALLIAAISWLGCLAMVALDGGSAGQSPPHPVEIVEGVPYPYALAFAAPVFFHAVRVWSAW